MVVLYAVNSRDELTWVGGQWERFALENGGAALLPEHVLGRPLWDFVSDATTRQLYREALARVRAGRAIRLPLRCDAPGLRRWLELTISPDEGGRVLFESRTLREEAREPVAVLGASGPRLEELLRCCSWCKRVEAGGEWLEVEEAVARLNLFEHAALPMLTHGMCEPCHDAFLAKIRPPGSPGGN
jgi:hypothetical protein